MKLPKTAKYVFDQTKGLKVKMNFWQSVNPVDIRMISPIKNEERFILIHISNRRGK